MENLAPIHINLTDKEMVPEASPRGYMAMVYENKLIALIIVLVVILLCVLAYMFWKRDGGKQAERQSPYRQPRRGGAANAQQVAQPPRPSREELERERDELDSDDESEEEDTAPKQETTEVSKPADEPVAEAEESSVLAESTETSEGTKSIEEPAANKPADTKTTCEFGNCKNTVTGGRKVCWRHTKK